MNLDQVFRTFAKTQGVTGTMIACLYTGRKFPSFCSPMPREPVPPVGMSLDEHFHSHVCSAIKLNSSVHDGAIMIGRKTSDADYKITGWSFRLFAPDPGHLSPSNRGSAFNSCLAAAQGSDVDRIYLHSAGQMYLFSKGGHSLIF